MEQYNYDKHCHVDQMLIVPSRQVNARSAQIKRLDKTTLKRTQSTKLDKHRSLIAF